MIGFLFAGLFLILIGALSRALFILVSLRRAGELLRKSVDRVDGGTHLGQTRDWQTSAGLAIEAWDKVA